MSYGNVQFQGISVLNLKLQLPMKGRVFLPEFLTFCWGIPLICGFIEVQEGKISLSQESQFFPNEGSMSFILLYCKTLCFPDPWLHAGFPGGAEPCLILCYSQQWDILPAFDINKSKFNLCISARPWLWQSFPGHVWEFGGTSDSAVWWIIWFFSSND